MALSDRGRRHFGDVICHRLLGRLLEIPRLARRRVAPDTEGGPTLRDVRLAVIELDCTVCDRRGSHDRAALVRAFGASISFARLRRRAAMGCDRLNTPEGDRCGSRFPCLSELKLDGG